MRVIPQRIRMLRIKGFNLQAVSKELNGLDCVLCTRPTDRGNPFVQGLPVFLDIGPLNPPNKRMVKIRGTAIDAAALFRIWLNGDIDAYPIERKRVLGSIAGLAGKNLACSCTLQEPCHVDVLLTRARAYSEGRWEKKT